MGLTRKKIIPDAELKVPCLYLSKMYFFKKRDTKIINYFGIIESLNFFNEPRYETKHISLKIFFVHLHLLKIFIIYKLHQVRKSMRNGQFTEGYAIDEIALKLRNNIQQ